jgi:hypothetical protein
MPGGSGTDRDVELFFLERANALAVHDDECTLSVIDLGNGQPIGKIRAAFSNHVKVQQVAEDLIAVYSADWYDATHSVQLIDYPNLEQGPWILIGQPDDYESNPVDASGGDARPAAAPAQQSPGKQPVPSLVTYGDEMAIAFQTEGSAVLAGPKDGPPNAIAMPPWGKRLRELLVK